MTTKYIRDIVTGKAALVSNEEEFKKQYPSGKYRYFEVDNGEAAIAPAPKDKPENFVTDTETVTKKVTKKADLKKLDNS